MLRIFYFLAQYRERSFLVLWGGIDHGTGKVGVEENIYTYVCVCVCVYVRFSRLHHSPSVGTEYFEFGNY